MKLLTVDTIETAREKLLDCIQSWQLPIKRLSPLESLGQILAEDLYSPSDIPAFHRSTVDGYAVAAADTAGAGESIPVFLTLIDRVEMGKSALVPVKPGECVYVPTGGMIPQGADAVVMIEYSESFAGNSIAVYEAAAVGTGLVCVGEDLEQGSILLRRGARIRPQEAGALAAAGIIEVPVYEKLTLTLISIGDELVSPEQEPGAGQIRDINTSALYAMALESGYRVLAAQVLTDDEALLEQTVREAMAVSDVVAVSGGSSQGEKDATAAVLDRVANPGVFTHGLALKPGKPTILGYDDASKTILVGLPGHPVAAMMVFKLLLSPLLDTLSGQAPAFPVPARISCNIAGFPGRTTCQSVSLRLAGDGYIAEPIFGKSGMISTLTRADGYIIIDKNKEGLQKHESVWVYLF
ncbi:molybdopterin molybdenumtransferase MoeA [Spirochaetia bacterium]|nr:molybdopterin molybdenumtransferase MoeA [Spirochaetia bacterium]